MWYSCQNVSKRIPKMLKINIQNINERWALAVPLNIVNYNNVIHVFSDDGHETVTMGAVLTQKGATLV